MNDAPRAPRPALLGLVLALLWAAPPAAATVGLAEWEIVTPGGNRVAHTDTWKETEGDVIVNGDPLHPRLLVSRVRRWQYVGGLIVGEAGVDGATGWFVVDEASLQVTPFPSEEALRGELGARKLPAPTAWYTAGDGWAEAWYPIYTWTPCRAAAGLSGTTPIRPPLPDCAERMDAAHLEAAGRTWKGYCARLPATPPAPSPPTSEMDQEIAAFCRAVAALGEGRR
jgi:hypothetical protein